MEASGTSGMKVLPNGGLNLSVLDGWWVEGYEPGAGWAIGKGEEYEDLAYQDAVESSALYDLLENDVVPVFYDRGADGLPRGWIQRMKRSMKKLTPQFGTNRMLWEYAERYYEPAARCGARVAANDLERARSLAAFRESLRAAWSGVRVESVEATGPTTHRVGAGLSLVATVRLGPIDPGHVAVEAYHGPLSPSRQIRQGRAARLTAAGSPASGVHRFWRDGAVRDERDARLQRARPARPPRRVRAPRRRPHQLVGGLTLGF
jgi:starch phosphorylase